MHGADLGLLIGKHGQTIDAVQYARERDPAGDGETPRDVVVDAAGYRDAAAATLEAIAVPRRRGGPALAVAGRARADDGRRAQVVHECLKEHDGVETASEGAEPQPYVVVLVSANELPTLEDWLPRSSRPRA